MNSFSPVDPKLIDVKFAHHDGYPDSLKAGDTIDVLRDVCGAATRSFPQELWIEPRDWKDKAHENDKNQTWAINYIDRYTNQNPTHECTCHSLRANFEAARNRQRGIIFPDGPKADFRYENSIKGSVWVSPNSIYAEANPRQWGGAGIRQVLEIACRRGFLPEKIQPYEYNFKHSMQGTTGKGGKNQSTGPWLSLAQFPEGWKETAKLLVPLEIIFPESYEQAVCLVLSSRVVSVGRNGHAVPWAIWMATNGEMGYPDSYDVTRYDSKSTVKSAWSGSFSIATVTTPDDWSNPASTLAL